MKESVNTISLNAHTKGVRKVISDHLYFANEPYKAIKGKKAYSPEIFANIAMNHSGCNGPLGCSQRTIDMLFRLHKNSKNFKHIIFED